MSDVAHITDRMHAVAHAAPRRTAVAAAARETILALVSTAPLDDLLHADWRVAEHVHEIGAMAVIA